VRAEGPLAEHQESFEAALAQAGFPPWTTSRLLWAMVHLSRWLGENRCSAADLTPEVVSAFLSARRAAGATRQVSLRALRPLLDHLRQLGAAPAVSVEVGPVEELIARYRRFLITERGLVPGSVATYVGHVRPFLTRFCGADAALQLEQIGAAEVTKYVMERSLRPKSDMKHLVSALRSVLRFLVIDGVLARDLSAAVPAVAGWRNRGLPRGLSPEQVAALIESCDLSRPVGRRDRAILMLLARLGLRACEVARLRLDDFDWHHGELTVRGKGSRDERLPIPPDVGEAVVAYLRSVNDRGAAREVFVRTPSPVAAMTAQAVCDMVRHTGVRAGLGPVGAHRLRHTAASQMLRAGTPLPDVGQVLRHRNSGTTAIYAKVDRIALRSLARPWPGVTA
jgi:site-specific recombinase XerD